MMKFQLKALAVALSLVAVSVPAHAAVDAATSGNGSLILTVLDKVANVSATFDLGKNYLDFNQSALAGAVSTAAQEGVTFSWNLTQGDYASAWNSFLGAANLANVTYGVFAGDNLGPNVGNAGVRGYITTYASAGASTTTTALLTALAVHDTYVGNAGVAPGSTLLSAANGGAFTSPATNFYLGNKNNNTGPVATGAINTSLQVAQSLNAPSALTAMTTTVLGNGAKFTLSSTGALTYATNPITAPIPEADTWAMMLAGLGMMGFIARRRNRNQA